MVMDNDGVASKTTKEKVKSLALKSKVTREQTGDDSDSQGESDEEKAEAFNLLARNFQKFFRKGGESSKPKGSCYNCGIELVNLERRRKTKPSVEDHKAITKMVMKNSMMKHVSWLSTLKR
nr:hypothetical protein [Tanacetum cinerariifolium]